MCRRNKSGRGRKTHRCTKDGHLRRPHKGRTDNSSADRSFPHRSDCGVAIPQEFTSQHTHRSGRNTCPPISVVQQFRFIFRHCYYSAHIRQSFHSSARISIPPGQIPASFTSADSSNHLSRISAKRTYKLCQFLHAKPSEREKKMRR
jgi:hypothetical protein